MADRKRGLMLNVERDAAIHPYMVIECLGDRLYNHEGTRLGTNVWEETCFQRQREFPSTTIRTGPRRQLPVARRLGCPTGRNVCLLPLGIAPVQNDDVNTPIGRSQKGQRGRFCLDNMFAHVRGAAVERKELDAFLSTDLLLSVSGRMNSHAGRFPAVG